MDGHEEWPHHASVKERLDAGTIGQPVVKARPERVSAAAKLLEIAEISEWTHNDAMKERVDAGTTDLPGTGKPTKTY